MPFRQLFEKSGIHGSCLDSVPYEEWLRFVFDHPTPKSKDEDRWYSLESAERYYFKDSRLFLERLTRLFSDPEFLLETYSVAQVKQGLWCAISAFELPDLLDDADLDFLARKDCIESVEILYRKLLSKPGFEKMAFLFWDPLSYPFHAHPGALRSWDEGRVCKVMFETLVKILMHPQRPCFLGALHGLGHLGHPATGVAIRQALAERKDLREGDRAYAQACVKGMMDSQTPPALT